jgi:NADH-quinone oxidoreductase subunit D
MAYGFTGPIYVLLVLIMMRVAQPYSSYEDFEFNVPVGKSGDTYDRFVFVMLRFGKV